MASETQLLRSRDDVVSYLLDKRDALRYVAQITLDIRNEEGAKILRLAAEQLTATIRYLVDVPATK